MSDRHDRSGGPQEAHDDVEDRRAHPRHAFEISVELVAGDDLYFTVSGNVSVGGAFFDRAIPHPVGTQVVVGFELPGEDGPPIRTRAEVVNVPRDGGGLGMGVRFLDVEEADRARLERFAREVSASSDA